ncbi:MAG: tyrosine-type recombinase/integrase [Terriglobia bacterium]
MQARYQFGNLARRERKKGPDVWQFRYFENGKRKSVLIGTVEKLLTKADAERAVEHRRMQINADSPQRQFHSVTVGALIDRFMEEYAPRHCRLNTQRDYRYSFKTHVQPKWGAVFIQNVKTMAVQDWLDNYPHSRQVKAHIRRYMHVLFNQAVRWELLERNPITLVKQSGKRLKTPRALTPEEFKAFLGELAEPHRTMVITATVLGLRACELLSLRWGDVSFENLTISVQRSLVGGEVNPTKTTASEGTPPLDPELAEILLQHKERATFKADEDYVFAGSTGKWRWKDSILSDYLKPAAARAKIGKVGWHTFRHTYRALLKRCGTQLEVQKELMRHSDLRTTVGYGIESDVAPANREANSKVVKMLLGN